MYFITAREETKGLSVVKQSIAWLENLGWKNPQVLCLNNKADAVRNLGITHFIDDKTQNILEIKNGNPDCNVYAFDVPHNKDLELKLGPINGYYRVKSLTQFTDILKANLKWQLAQ